MKILVSGSTGLVGSVLTSLLAARGHAVVPLVRRAPAPDTFEVEWDPAGGKLNGAELEGLDAVVHLAGENIASRRWSEAQKARIRDSRVQGTYLLATTLAALKQRPKVLVSASAIGYYGNRGQEVLSEKAAAGTDFLSDICRKWEAAAKPAIDAGVRVVFLRFGVILSPAGGALAKMLLPFRLCAGGKVGSGRQYMSWISLDDAVGAAYHALTTEDLSGPVNVVAPAPVSNAEFTRTLGRVLRRPTIFPMPAVAARLAFGEMADELLLASTRVEPAKLVRSGYAFQHPQLELALRHLLERR